MAVSRIKVWVNGDVLTAPDLNAEIDNILQNPVALISPSTASIDFGNYDAVNFTLENLITAPGNVSTGRLYYYSPSGVVVLDIGTANGVRILGPHAGIPRVSGLSGSLISNIGSFSAQGYQLIRPPHKALASVTATSSFSVNTQTAGPIVNGRDQAAVFASTDVHFYAISTGVGSTTIQGVASSTPPPAGPTLPTGYENWAYLCSAKYNTVTSAVVASLMVSGNALRFLTPQITINASTHTGGVLTTVGVVNPTSGWVPGAAVQMRLKPMRYGAGIGSTGLLDVRFLVATASSQPTEEELDITINYGVAGGVDYFLKGPSFTLPVIQSSPALWYSINNVSSAALPNLQIRMQGYTVANGDVG